jgi:NADH-quinone oxidoreductase subunit I
VSIWGTGILKGMGITMRNMLRGPITVQYPHEKIELPERARWAVRMTLDEQGSHKCTACLACERACPDHIIKIDVTTDEARNKHIDAWTYEIGACMMCSLCVEACPFDAIHMSHDYELARIDPAELTENLLTDVPAAKPARKAAEPRPAAAAAQAPAAAVPQDAVPASDGPGQGEGGA